MSPHPSPDEMARRLSVKHGQLLKDLTTELSLSDAQVASMKTVLDARVKTFRASLDKNAGPDAQKEMVIKAGSLIRGTGLRDELVAILSEKQLTAFDEREKKPCSHRSNRSLIANSPPSLPCSNFPKSKKTRSSNFSKHPLRKISKKAPMPVPSWH